MTDAIARTRLLTRKGDHGTTMVETDRISPAPGEIVLRLDRFSLTANNLTYADFGVAMNYWDFFPTGQPDYGHMPVWGFADVVSSSVDGIAEGERFYGYFPIASHVLMRPERVTPRGFYDGAEHRKPLVSAYNQYARCSADPVYDPSMENLLALYRPLFLTSFMLADFLEDNDFFGASQVLFSSASSKTCYGAAYCLPRGGDRRFVALTSERNGEFVRGLGLYDDVVGYGDFERIDRSLPTLYVDFSGNAQLRERIHQAFGAALVHDCYAGSASESRYLEEVKLPGPKPKFFFAPIQIRKRNEDWGGPEVTRRYNAAQTRFFADAAKADPAWVEIVEDKGFDAAAKVIARLARGDNDPRSGNVVVL